MFANEDEKKKKKHMWRFRKKKKKKEWNYKLRKEKQNHEIPYLLVDIEGKRDLNVWKDKTLVSTF